MLDITYYVTDTKMYLVCLFVLWEKRLKIVTLESNLL